MNYLFILLFYLLSFGCDPTGTSESIDGGSGAGAVELTMVDSNATAETKALYANLWAIRDSGTIFGHHEGLLYGRKWNNLPGKSDIKDVCGDYPGISSFDFSKIENDDIRGINSSLFSDVRRVVKEAYARGEIITFCWHADNPLTGGTSWDNSNENVLHEILIDGSAMNLKFKSWLDKLAAFNATLTDERGRPIPIVFRPFHEHTQTWNWWGKKCATEDEFIGIWRFTIQYLRDVKQVHNFIYAISPQMDYVQPKEDLLFRWPGDEWVDFLGMDCYHGTNTEAFVNNITNLSTVSREKKKPFGITETGLEGLKKNGNEYVNYWTKEILTPITGRKASFVIFWRNMYDPTGNGKHFYAPFEGQASVPDFLKFYKSPVTIFSNELPNMYVMPRGYTVK